jgi:hypothetical protein
VANSDLSPSVIANKAPGSGFFSLLNQSSPVEVWPASHRPSELWASAAGYEPRQILVDFDRPGERVVLLRSVGDLEIEVADWIEEFGATIYVRRSGSDEDAHEAAPDADGRAHVHDLAIGRYTITIEVHGYGLVHGEFGRVEAEVLAGELTQVTLQARIPPRQERTKLAGEFIAGDEWHVDRFMCSLDLLDVVLYHAPQSAGFLTDAGVSVGNGLSAYHWTVDDLQCGRYVLSAREAQFHRPVDVRTSSTAVLSFAIAPPAIVRVRDATTQEPFDTVGWHLWVGETPQRLVETPGGLYADQFSAPIGEWLAIRGPQFSTSLRVEPGINEVLVPRATRQSIKLKFFDGVAQIPWPRSGKIRVEALSGSGALAELTANEWIVPSQLKLTQPGAYRLTFSKLDGYGAIEPLVVSVAAGEDKPVRIDLVRDW